MFLAEPQPTPGDLRFPVRGIAVRVSAWFWVAAALLGWNVCRGLAGGDQRELVRYLFAWVAVVFVSILIHEMGHALAYRAFGQSAHVVLYHFGGLAIPDRWGRRGARRPFERLLVAALRAGGFRVPFPFPDAAARLGLDDGRPIPSPLGLAVVFFLLQVNVLWPLLNLVPVPPLDGGQIVREGLAALGVDDAPRIATLIGAVAGAGVSFWAYSQNEPYLGIMFAMLAVSCFQGLSAGGSWNRWR